MKDFTKMSVAEFEKLYTKGTPPTQSERDAFVIAEFDRYEEKRIKADRAFLLYFNKLTGGSLYINGTDMYIEGTPSKRQLVEKSKDRDD